jgi:hypothetical protein
MEDVQRTYRHDDEFRGLYNGMGIDSKESKEEHIKLVETINGLQKYVQSYKDDKERLVKSKEEQDGSNITLMKILERIEKKMDNEMKSSNSRNRRSHDERRKKGSVDRNHHHSPKHSFRKTCNILSPSPVRKNKIRTRVDMLQGKMNKIKPPTFDSEHKKDENEKTLQLGMRKYFQLHNYSTQVEEIASIYQIKGKSSMWWDYIVQVQQIDEKKVSWRDFKIHFQNKYLTKRYYDTENEGFL